MSKHSKKYVFQITSNRLVLSG